MSKYQEWKNKFNQTRLYDLFMALDSNNHIDPVVSDKRMALCEQCPELIQLTKQCKKCGCFMPLKTKYNQAYCPLEKW